MFKHENVSPDTKNHSMSRKGWKSMKVCFNQILIFLFLSKALFNRLVPEKHGKREFSNIMLGRLKVILVKNKYKF